MYYSLSKEFLEAGKRRLAGDTARAATTGRAPAPRRRVSRAAPAEGAAEIVAAEDEPR